MDAVTVARKPMVYVVDDDSRLAETVCKVLDRAGYETRAFEDGMGAVSAVSDKPPDLVVLDLMLPDIDGIEVLRRVRKEQPDLAVVMMSGKGTVRTAVESLKLGAYDFMEKPLDANRLKTTVRNALERRLLQKKVSRLQSELEESFRMIGSSPALQRVRDIIGRAAPTSASVLITGESGTGKELVARAIHLQSPRVAESFIALNCAAIPGELIESDLFGHEMCAFNGAAARHEGKLKQADNGTLFLDEVGDMSIAAQAKLLRFLETSEIQRLGDSESTAVDVRIVAATNQKLGDCIERGTFREDLFHRLNVVGIEVPPLRKRPEDIEQLATYFLERYCQRHNRSLTLARGCSEVLGAYDWPGNVRELRNLMERVVVLAQADPVSPEELRSFVGAELSAESDGTLRSALEQAERETIRGALAKTKGNVTQAAHLLGIERPSLHRIMKRLGIVVADA